MSSQTLFAFGAPLSLVQVQYVIAIRGVGLSAVGIDPLRRVYDLRHTFATFALRAGIPTFDLSRYMGAGLTMIDGPPRPRRT